LGSNDVSNPLSNVLSNTSIACGVKRLR